jgi:hypothetical protein
VFLLINVITVTDYKVMTIKIPKYNYIMIKFYKIFPAGNEGIDLIV